MKFLKNKLAWKRWIKTGIFSIINKTEVPNEFPCFVYLECVSFSYEEERAVYLSKYDFRRMIVQIEHSLKEQTPRKELKC